jgi:cytochrome c556
MMKKIPLFLLILSVFFPAWLGVAHQGATGIVKQRMDAFKTSQKQLKSIVAAAKVEDFDTTEKLAKSLAEWGKKMPEYFPAGSQVPPSEAAPAIWSDFSGFSRAAEIYTQSAEQLITASTAGDREAVFAAIRQVGQSCKSCHATYRAD